MTVYPLRIQIGFLEITGYGIMVMVGFLIAGWSIQIYLRERGLNEDYAADIVFAAVIGGLVGAKLWYVALHGTQALFSRGGLVWYGGFVGGSMGVWLNGLRKGVPVRLTLELVAPALAVGYAVGRVGCFLVGDDYGRPSTVPWAVKFPQGMPPTTAGVLERDFGVAVPGGVLPTDVIAVHPSQLYEVVFMFAVFVLLWKLRSHTHAPGWLFGLYLAFAGVERFLVEFVRAKDDRFFGPFTLAQVTSLSLVAIGMFLLARFQRAEDHPPLDLTALTIAPDTGGKRA